MYPDKLRRKLEDAVSKKLESDSKNMPEPQNRGYGNNNNKYGGSTTQWG